MRFIHGLAEAMSDHALDKADGTLRSSLKANKAPRGGCGLNPMLPRRAAWAHQLVAGNNSLSVFKSSTLSRSGGSREIDLILEFKTSK
jgi:hypothetical protein